MRRRLAVVACLGFGLLAAPGVASAGGCWDRGEPPCHATTTAPTTTVDLSGTSATSTTTTTALVSGTSAASTTPATSAASATSTAPATSAANSSARVTSVAPSVAAVVVTTRQSAPDAAPGSTRVLANTGPGALWPTLLGLGGVLAGALLVLFSRRRA